MVPPAASLKTNSLDLTTWTVQVRVNSWQHPLKAPIQAMAQAAASPRRMGLPRLGVTCPLLYVAAGPSEIGLWDVEHARCHQVGHLSFELVV